MKVKMVPIIIRNTGQIFEPCLKMKFSRNNAECWSGRKEQLVGDTSIASDPQLPAIAPT